MKTCVHYVRAYDAAIRLVEGQPKVLSDAKDEIVNFLGSHSFDQGDTRVDMEGRFNLPQGRFLWIETGTPAVMIDTYPELHPNRDNVYMRHVDIESMSPDRRIPGELETFLREKGFRVS